ncbi:MAG: TetR/AcrR family transcriptional regulator [Sterolibacterium sp.]|nr:TetR/AcrR family transcriptional regulator [Sterolibacterium sp.]
MSSTLVAQSGRQNQRSRRISSTRAAALAERAAFTDGQILDAAELLFARHGLRGTRVREIAAEAGVNEATLYNYYKNKQALYEAVLERGIQPIIETVRRTSAGANSPENIRAAAQQIITQLQRRPHVSRLIYLEAIADGEHLEPLIQRWLQPFAETITRQLSKRAPHLSQQDYPQIVELFWHLSFGHFAIAPLLQKTFGDDPLADHWVERQIAFIETLIGSLFVQGMNDAAPVTP